MAVSGKEELKMAVAEAVSPQMLTIGSMRDHLLKAAEKMPILAKDDANPSEGWNFVSIDAYYEHGASVLRSEGVSWVVTEIGFEPINHGNAALFGFRFRFDLYSADGYWPNVSQLTVLHEMEGPQTTGKVVSYAEKVFLRSLLKMVTGEADADSSPTRPKRSLAAAGQAKTPNPAPEPRERDYGLIQKELKAAIDVAALDTAAKRWKPDITYAKSNDPEDYKRIMKAYTDRKQELTNAKA